MKKYIKDLFDGFIHGTLKKKIITILLALMAIFVLVVSIVPVQVSSTSPGSINQIASVITFENGEDVSLPKRSYTVSVYSKTKASILEYWISKLDKNTDVKIDKREDEIYTINEENKIDVIAKDQSIQDSLILAYDTAKNNGYDVNLNYTYKGIRVACVPVNALKTGPESLQIGDIVTEINGEAIDDITEFKSIVSTIYENHKANTASKTANVKVLRDSKELELSNCDIRSLSILGQYTSLYENNVPEYIFYEYFELDLASAKPKFSINKAYSSGPSGGLMQTLYVYDAITKGSIINTKYVLSTGTISRNGNVGEIGGIKQKIMTAHYYQCEYFFVPSANYDDALSQYNTLKDPSYQLVKVDTIEDAINALKGGN